MADELSRRPHGVRGALARHLKVRADAITRMANTDPDKESREIKAHEHEAMKVFFASRPPPMHDDSVEPPQPQRMTEQEEWEEEQKASFEREARENRAYWNDPMAWRERYRPSYPGMFPEIDTRVGAGEGEVGDIVQLSLGGESYSGHKIIGEWLFPEEYLRAEINASPSQTLVMPVKGDSMEPTYRPGDRVLVDLSQKTLTEDTVYVISDGSSAPRIKRLVEVLFSKPRMVEIVSDNQSVDKQTVPLADVVIVGRVVGVVSRR